MPLYDVTMPLDYPEAERRWVFPNGLLDLRRGVTQTIDLPPYEAMGLKRIHCLTVRLTPPPQPPDNPAPAPAAAKSPKKGKE